MQELKIRKFTQKAHSKKWFLASLDDEQNTLSVYNSFSELAQSVKYLRDQKTSLKRTGFKGFYQVIEDRLYAFNFEAGIKKEFLNSKDFSYGIILKGE